MTKDTDITPGCLLKLKEDWVNPYYNMSLKKGEVIMFYDHDSPTPKLGDEVFWTFTGLCPNGRLKPFALIDASEFDKFFEIL